ncbi:WW domain-binding protein 4-like [Stylophora pistillata]|uniref:WW domain-binding protein 4-like n=1 Tax=Stylophora pistillata TaxID=50429 RepID=UPI000C03DF25|nr:WW domain-binding protein 4-like [Stylophora pistillata]
MAEYWKSQPKKMCEFCKCWITDNKASIEFHERGKKHKENVQKRIQEVQKKGKETSQAQKQLQMDLEAIEAAALKAYEKDLNIEPSKSNPESNAKSQKHRQMKLVPMVKALLVRTHAQHSPQKPKPNVTSG